MLVDLVPLRSDGLKLSPTALRTLTPTRGDLTISTHHTGPTRAPGVAAAQVSAQFTPCDDPGPLVLMDARITRMHGDGFVVVGVENLGHPTLGPFKPQAWWCRLAVGDAGQPQAVASADACMA